MNLQHVAYCHCVSSTLSYSGVFVGDHDGMGKMFVAAMMLPMLLMLPDRTGSVPGQTGANTTFSLVARAVDA